MSGSRNKENKARELAKRLRKISREQQLASGINLRGKIWATRPTKQEERRKAKQELKEITKEYNV